MKKEISLLLIITLILVSCQQKKGEYVCPPCNQDCDNLIFPKPGTCPHCHMHLIARGEVKKDSINPLKNINFKEKTTGMFRIEGGFVKDRTILVHYYLPKNFSKSSNVIFVIPGGGRNGKEYMNAWIDASEKYNLVVLSLEYSEEHYPEFWSYNLGGMIYDVNLQNESFKINQNPEHWIFGDFDRIFDRVKIKLNLISENYDMFGHSAGGQILHRLAIFKPNNKANRILASNSGWYTIPTTADVFPYGLRNIREAANRLDFRNQLILFLGEEDNENETRGHLRRSPEANEQGLHRLDRGNYFFNSSKKIASQLNKEFNWELQIVPNVGHDYRKMSQKAAIFLYDSNYP